MSNQTVPMILAVIDSLGHSLHVARTPVGHPAAASAVASVLLARHRGGSARPADAVFEALRLPLNGAAEPVRANLAPL